jgi:signal transduction histidine kinase
MSGRLAGHLPHRWLRAQLPARTIRMRLTAVYGGLFLLSGTALLAITYVLVRREYTGKFFVSNGAAGIAKQLLAQGKELIPQGKPRGVIVQSSGPVFQSATKTASVLAAAGAQSSAALHQLLIDSGIALAIMAILSIWLGWLIAGRALQPLRTISNAARDISASSLHRRLNLEGPDDELKQLGRTFDDLLGRLEASFDAQRQFVTNASHELRTPLTLERTLIEVALADPEADEESLRRTCRQVLAVGEQQERLIEALLTLSRSQRGLDVHEPVDLAAITAAAVGAADCKGLSVVDAFEPAQTTGDARLVERLVANLVANAIRHNEPGGYLSVATETVGDRSVLTVTNSGPKISPTELPRLFRPFQRLNIDRTGDTPGLGLGLSIVDAIARAHGATVDAVASEDGGLRVAVAFPAGSG